MMLMELGSGGAGGGGVTLLHEAVGGGPGLSHAPSSASASAQAGSSIRFVRLLRRRGETYGFSLRGGKEHGTGFFISHVEPGSEAYHNGLRAGDQVLRVNNLCVEQAVHREVAAMVQAKNSVILKVRSTGIIPIKENRGDPLTWMVVDDDDGELSDNGTETYSHSLPSTSMPETDTDSFQQSPPNASDSYSQSQSSTSTNESHARVYITYNAKTGLGCSICKGPPEKNGIFVQSAKSGGVAKEAGLRPGDQILACNDVSFQHLEFAEAVYVLKSSPHLTLDVLRGAGLDLVAGESSGYNSSASSVAGDQTPPSATSSGSSDTSHKDIHRRSSSHDSVASRLSAVSRHLTLDRSRGWREIEAEWANAEAEQKRQQLTQNQKSLKTRAQRDAASRSIGRSVGTSRSMSNLLVHEEDEEEETTAFRDAPVATATLQRNKHVGYKSNLRSAVSTCDLVSAHKIALVTSADPHVNNIVVTQGPKDEKDAVSRLEQLSSHSTDSWNSTVSSSASQVTVRSSLGDLRFGTHDSTGAPINPQVEAQLRELREEQLRLQLEANRLAEDRLRFEEERRSLHRTQSVPLSPTSSPTTPLLINCSTPPSSLSQPPPSPTPSTASGRHTTRVIIKSAPPPPPLRKNSTTLTSTLTRRAHRHHHPSPPASPSHSSSSSGVGSSCGSGGPPPRRCKSIGSLSASSGESSLWEDSPNHPSTHQLHSISNNHKAQYSSSFRPRMPPPPTPPKPTSSSSTTLSPQAAGGVPPPPPPPPQAPPAAAAPSLANALFKEIEKRGQQQEASVALNGTDASSRTQKLDDKIDAFKKERLTANPPDPSKGRNDKLMDELKLAHKRMFKDPLEGKDQSTTPVNTSQVFSKANLKPVTSITPQSEQTKPVVSKIINNNNINTRVEQTSPITSKIINNSKITKTPVTTTKVVNQVIVNGENRGTENNFKSTIVNSRSVNKTSNERETIIITSADKKVSIGSSNAKPVLKQSKDFASSNSNIKSVISSGNESTPSVLKLSQQWNERSGGTNISVPSIKASTRPGVTSASSSSVLLGSTTVEMNELTLGTLQRAKPKEPNTYFEVKKKPSDNSKKPLVSINVYPSAMQRPTPLKMDFLPTSSNTTETKPNGNVSNITKKMSLQSELSSTLNRSPLRQRLKPQDLSEDHSTSTGTPTTNGNIFYLNSSATYDTNDNFPYEIPYDTSVTPSTTLSSKYSCLGTDISSVTFINDVEEGFREGYRDSPPDALAESPPAGILKQAPRPTQHKPLHKSISFGDVTTVGDDELTS